MATSVTAPGLYDLRSWQNASASFSLVSAADAQTALEQLLETLTRTVSDAVALSETDSAMRTVGVIEHAARSIAAVMASMPASLFYSALKSRADADQLAYEVSTTRIARSDQTGVLVRVRETTGDLTLSAVSIKACLAFISRQMHASIDAVLPEWPQVAGLADSPDDFRIAISDDSLDISRTSASRAHQLAGQSVRRGLPMFLRSRLRLQHDDAGRAEATVMLLFTSDA
ncbi:MAG: hypothetical protein AAGA44_15955 [Pseudomonadota bacterium]